MIARIQKSMKEKDQGFTLIELLVVMIIIGILAAVAIPIFLSQREKAEDSAAKADVSTLGKEVATWFVDNTALPYVGTTGSAPDLTYELGETEAAAEPVGPVSDNVELGTISATDTSEPATTWCVFVTNESGDAAVDGYQYSAAGGLEEGDCGAAAAGAGG